MSPYFYPNMRALRFLGYDGYGDFILLSNIGFYFQRDNTHFYA